MQPSLYPRRAVRAVSACVLAGSLAVALSACGASGSSASASSGSGSGSSSSSSRYQARLKFAECMRQHGVNVPDPSASGAIGGGGGPGGGPDAGPGEAFKQAQQSPNFQSAIKACASLRAKAFQFANITAAQRQQFHQDAVKFAECMRSHGIDIPDPTTNGQGGFGIFRDLKGSVQTNSPAFQSAMQACVSNLPFRPGGGPGGPGGGPPAIVGG
jgi:hypothetical protein